MKPSKTFVAMLAIAILTACSGTTTANPAGPSPTQSIDHSASSSPIPKASVPTAASTEPAPTPDLEAEPLVWFGPLPPMTTGPGRPFIGSEDFMDLFSEQAAWKQAAEAVQVFKLYGEWVAYNASDAELEQVVVELRRRGMALAVEAGPLNATDACGQGVEGFAGMAEGQLIADRIEAAGGTIDLIALDEPYYFAHVYDGPNACHWSAAKIAEGVDAYIRSMTERFPQVIIGDTEPFPAPTSPEEYRDWLLTFRQVTGYDLAFLHMDLDWSRSVWPEQALQMEEYGRALGIPIGIIYIGNSADPDDATWIGITGERIRQHQFEDGGEPDHVLFQSWVDHPDFVLPESNPDTFTGLIRTYSTAPGELGIKRQGAGANLALDTPVRVSAIEAGHPGADALDGDSGTHWSAGAMAPQWIEINLGQAYDVKEIRLIPSQYPAGETTHRVLGKGAAASDEFRLLHTFAGFTEDGLRLVFTPESAWQGIQYVRIATDGSPSWVGWREIELIAADG
ncbi:MAG: discoidin domain-containing protein [Anaerolineales bacterium]